MLILRVAEQLSSALLDDDDATERNLISFGVGVHSGECRKESCCATR